MRPNPDTVNLVTTAQLFERLRQSETSQASLRQGVVGQLSRAPLVSARVASSTARMAEGLVAGAAGLMTAILHPGFEETGAVISYVPVILAVSAALPLLAHSFGRLPHKTLPTLKLYRRLQRYFPNKLK